MFDVPDFEVDQHFAKIGRVRYEGDIVDIAADLADRRRNDAERPRLIERGDDDLGRVELLARAVDVPAHVEPSLGLVVEGRQRWRMNRVDRNTLPRGQDADD